MFASGLSIRHRRQVATSSGSTVARTRMSVAGAPIHSRVVRGSADLALKAVPRPTAILQAVPRPTAILDVGCGRGALLGALSSRLPSAVELDGVDPAPRWPG